MIPERWWLRRRAEADGLQEALQAVSLGSTMHLTVRIASAELKAQVEFIIYLL